MKSIIFLIGALYFLKTTEAQNVGIGTTTPASSAKLEVSSTTQGFLPPRMTATQRDNIDNPAAGLVIWCSDCDELQVFNGTIWKNLSGAAASQPGFPNVRICDQVWMIKNLNVVTYRNGDTIPQVTDLSTWNALTTGAWCWYNNDPLLGAIYGKIYNWYAVNDSRGLAPTGWHVPTETEWNKLTTCLDNGADTACSNCYQSLIAGGAMKQTTTAYWQSPNTGATNSTGFTGLPGGNRSNGSDFTNVSANAFWWSATQATISFAWYHLLYWNNTNTGRAFADKSEGFYVRCVRD